MKIENNKIPIIAVLILAVIAIGAVVAFDIDVGELMGASLVSSSFVTETDGTSYVYVQISEDTYDKQDIGTIKNIGFESIEIDGQTNSDGDELEGDFTSTFRVKINDIGFGSDVTAYKTVPIVDHCQIDGTIFKSVSYDMGDPVTYYQVTGDTSVLSSYTLMLNVNGKEFTQTIDHTTPEGLVKIEGTDPAIYWDETSFGLTRATDFPTGIDNVDIITDPQGNINFIKKDQTVQMVKFWNAIFQDNYVIIKENTATWNLPSIYTATYHTQMPKRIDLNNDDEYDLDAPGNDFSYMNLMSNDYRFKSSSSLLGGLGSVWVNFPSADRAPFAYVKDNTGYSIVTAGDDYLKRDTILTVSGVWRIPVEYGDVRVKTALPVPEIIGTPGFTETMYTTTTTTLTINVKNVGDTGPIYVGAYATGSPGLIMPPNSKAVEVMKGETYPFTLTFKGETNVNDALITVFAKGGVTTDTVDIRYSVIPYPTEEELKDTETYRIIINAVDKDGDLLGSNFPITVSQNSRTSYGVWIGDLLAGVITVFGDEVVHDDVRYYPNDFEYEVVEDATISLMYTTDPPGEKGTDWTFAYVIAAILIIAGAAYWLWRD